ncbi:MAG: hypothetical protein WAN59_02255 [Candidatus Baltobacteraceae bacterium]
MNAVGAENAQSFSVSESYYNGTWTESDTCATGSVASVSTSDHINFTVTPSAAGTCTITVSDSYNQQASVGVTVTTTSIGLH